MSKIIFFDFDGVIKESLEVKSSAFFMLFEPFGNEIAIKVKTHHENNGGMSRFEKFPIYFSWCGLDITPELIDEYCLKFKDLTVQGVIDSEWVPGIQKYITEKHKNYILIVVSATPQNELNHILKSIGLSTYFKEIYGSPVNKNDAINRSIQNYGIDPMNCLMIGDAYADLEAAQHNNVPFLLRLHNTNKELFRDYLGKTILDFIDYE